VAGATRRAREHQGRLGGPDTGRDQLHLDNAGRIYELERMALPDARGVKSAIERQKQKAGLYE
jgi:hypothetical protein